MVARKLEKIASDYEQISEQKRMCNHRNNLIFLCIYCSENLKIASEFASEKCIFGDKSSVLSPITGFRTQNPFRKPSDSSPQEPVTTSNNSWTKASLRWRRSIKTGSIGLNKSCFKINRAKPIRISPDSVLCKQSI